MDVVSDLNGEHTREVTRRGDTSGATQAALRVWSSRESDGANGI